MKAFQNTNWLIAEKVIALTGGLFSSVFIARTLGPEQFGIFNYLIATVFLFQPLMKFGLHSIITRDLYEFPAKQSEILKVTFIIRLAASALTIIVSLSLLYSSAWFNNSIIWLFIILMFGQLFSAFEVFSYWFEANVNAKPITIVRSFIYIIFIVIKVLVVFLYQDLTFLIVTTGIEFALGYVVVFLCFIKFSRSFSKIFNVKLDKTYMFDLIKQSFWLIFSAFAAAIYMKIDQVMLGAISASTEVGVYSVAVKFSEMAYFIPIAIVTSLFPSILKAKSENNDALYKEKLKLIMGGLFWLAFLGASICVVISGYLIEFTYGEQYLRSASILNIHIWGSVFVFVRALLSKWILAEKLYKYSLYTQGAGALTNITLNWFWIPEYGAEGAAWATLLSVAVSCWGALFLKKKTREMALSMSIAPFYFLFFNYQRYKNRLINMRS